MSQRMGYQPHRMPVIFQRKPNYDLYDRQWPMLMLMCWLMSILLRGFLIPMNQYSIYRMMYSRLSRKSLSLLMLSLDSTSCTATQEHAKSNFLHRPSPGSRNIKFPCRATTLLHSPWMVVCRVSRTMIPGIQYFRQCNNEKRRGRCGLNQLLATQKVTLWITRQLDAEHIRTVSSLNQTYVAWSWRCMREVMVIR